MEFIHNELILALNTHYPFVQIHQPFPATQSPHQSYLIPHESLLIIDIATFHIINSILTTLCENDFISIISGGCTRLLQPRNTGINKSFKEYL